ncbi:MAG: HisA/HisF-related TIM barrel protein [Promethearchaeota archaeon]|jgi:phosphoribosylformimino-5-aminoimidazole carboxamide ribotide isomerase
MTYFKIIPVIDILNSKAVHAVRGERTRYQPLESKLFNSTNPYEIIQHLNSKYSVKYFYIADLDSIIDNNPNLRLLLKILSISGIKIMIDPGINSSKDILFFSKFNIQKIIIGLETIHSFEVIRESVKLLGEEKIIISIDMYKGKILSKVESLKHQTPLELVKKLELLGVKDLILLDLFRVGQKIGGIPQEYISIRNSFNGNLYIGGGVKDYKDIIYYKQNKFSGLLIATALYDGTIDIEKLKSYF